MSELWREALGGPPPTWIEQQMPRQRYKYWPGAALLILLGIFTLLCTLKMAGIL